MELLHNIICLLSLCCRLHLGAYIGINSNKNIQMEEGEIDRSLVPMIRLPRSQSTYLKPSVSSYLNPTELFDSEVYQYTDNGLSPESDIKHIHGKSRKFADILKRQGKVETYISNGKSTTANGITALEEEKKEFTTPNERICVIDGQRVINSEEIFQNDCGTLQCIDSEVTWSLKPLAKSLPHCEGVKSIPSMYKSYVKIKVIDEDAQEQATAGNKSGARKSDVDIVDQRKKIEQASRRMIEAENWE